MGLGEIMACQIRRLSIFNQGWLLIGPSQNLDSKASVSEIMKENATSSRQASGANSTLPRRNGAGPFDQVAAEFIEFFHVGDAEHPKSAANRMDRRSRM